MFPKYLPVFFIQHPKSNRVIYINTLLLFELESHPDFHFEFGANKKNRQNLYTLILQFMLVLLFKIFILEFLLCSVKSWADKLGIELWHLGNFITRRKEVQDVSAFQSSQCVFHHCLIFYQTNKNQ